MTEPNFEFPALRDAQAKLDTARQRLATVFQEAGSDYNMDNVKSIHGSREEKVEQIRKDNKEIDELKSRVTEYQDMARAAANAPVDSREGGGVSGGSKVEGKAQGLSEALGSKFSNLREHKGYTQKLDVELKALFETGRFSGAGWDPEDLRSGRVELTPLRPDVHVVNHVPSGTISQSDYKFMEETTHSSGAAEIEEDAAYGQSSLALTERSKPVEKVAAWIPVTDEQLEDEPAARAYVENRLTQQLRRRVDSQILQGNGSTPNLEGTENVTGIQSQALGSDTTLDALYKLFTSIRDDGFAEPSVTFIAPSKWQDIMLLKTADGQYIWGHPAQQGPMTVWGVPVVQTTAVTSTKAIAGDYANYGMLFSRRGLDLQVTNSHGEFFINGKQAIRADVRLVMVHFRPKAFGEVTGL